MGNPSENEVDPDQAAPKAPSAFFPSTTLPLEQIRHSIRYHRRSRSAPSDAVAESEAERINRSSPAGAQIAVHKVTGTERSIRHLVLQNLHLDSTAICVNAFMDDMETVIPKLRRQALGLMLRR